MRVSAPYPCGSCYGVVGLRKDLNPANLAGWGLLRNSCFGREPKPRKSALGGSCYRIVV